MPKFPPFYILLFIVSGLQACGGSNGSSFTPTPTPIATGDIDLRELTTDEGLIRLYGSDGSGNLGVPVAGGYDVNGDGQQDFAMAAMLASPLARTGAGQVYLALGNGSINYALDTASGNINMLTFIGDGEREATGSEIWMGDVTGDGLGDLLIARQNYFASNPDRPGAGALTLIIGSTNITTLANDSDTFDLRSPPPSVNIITFTGAETLDRLGIWMRVGDIDGDGIDDIAVGADQSNVQATNSGIVYVIRGGDHLNTNATVDLADINGSALAGQIAQVLPPTLSSNFHFGATLNIADLDANGRAELIVGATLNRAGASITALNAPSGSAQGSGGAPDGRLFIIWDDNFPAMWPTGFSITADSLSTSGSITDISGGATASFNTNFFGEEIIGGLDYDGDGLADLFVGDISGNTFNFAAAGLGFVFFDAAQLKNQRFSIDNRPAEIDVTTILGPEPGAISSDTALHGDFDNDGIDDLAVASPHAAPLGRRSAGALHVLWGQPNWPATINLQDTMQPEANVFNITNIFGAFGTSGEDTGDTLAYSAAPGDIDNDGSTDLIVNEMVGNGLSSDSVDAGNLIIISGATLSQSK